MAHDDRTLRIHRKTPESAAMTANLKRAMALTARLNRLTFDASFMLIPPFYTTGGSDCVRIREPFFHLLLLAYTIWHMQ